MRRRLLLVHGCCLFADRRDRSPQRDFEWVELSTFTPSSSRRDNLIAALCQRSTFFMTTKPTIKSNNQTDNNTAADADAGAAAGAGRWLENGRTLPPRRI
eukprot:scaffold8536_cov36-Cyclotella_meneghiniana.AAC.10